MSSESTSQPQVTEISAESGEQILSLLQVQGEEGSGHETIQLVTTSGEGEGIDGQETLLLQPAIEVNGERHVILQQAQDPNTGEVLVFLQGENGETVCLPPEALNANIVQMGDGSGQVYTLALPSDADGSSVVVVSETAEGGEGEGREGATLVTGESLGNVLAVTTSAGTMDLAGSIETIVTSGDTFNIDQLAGEAALLASSSTSGTQVVQSVVGPLMATTATSETSSTTEVAETRTESNEDASSTTVTTSTSLTTTKETLSTQSITKGAGSKVENEISVNLEGGTPATETQEISVTTDGITSSSSSSAAAAAAAAATIVEEMNSIDSINSKLNEAVSKLGEDKDLDDKCEEGMDPNNMNYGSAVIQVQDANSTTSLDSLMANAMLAAGESNYVIMTTGEDGELPKEINLADVINAGSASGQTIFLQTSEGLVACQAATTGEDGSLQIVADGSEATSGQTLAYTLSSTSSGIELTPVSNVVSSTPNASSSTNRNNQVTSVSSSRSRFSRQSKPRINLPTSSLTSSSSSSSSSSTSLTSSLAVTGTTIGETLLLPSKHLVSSPSLNHTSNSSGSGFMINSNSLNTNSRRRTLPNRGGGGRSNISVSITPSGASSLSTNSSSPIIPVQPDAIHSSSSDFSTLKSSSSSETATDSSLLTEGVSRPSQLAASRRTYSKKNNIVWLNPETTTVAKRFAAATSSSITNTNTNITINNNLNSNSNLKDGKDEGGGTGVTGGKEKETAKTIDTNNDSKMIDLPVESMNDISLTTTTNSGISNSPTSSPLSVTTPSSSTSFTSSKLTVKPPTTLTVANVPTLRSTKRVSEPIIRSSATPPSSITPLSPSKSPSSSSTSSSSPASTSLSASSGMVNKDYSRVISTNVDKVPSSSGVVQSMIKVAAVPQLGRVVTPPGKVTSPVKPNSPIKVTSPTTATTTSSLKVTSPTKVFSPTKSQQIVESNSDFDLDFGITDDGVGGVGEAGGKRIDVVLSPSRSPSRRVTSPIKSPIISERNRLHSKDGSESDSEPIVRKPIDFDALIAATNPLNKTQGKGNQQSTKQNDLSESLKKSTEIDAPKTRSGRKRLSESESGSDQIMVSEDNVKSTLSNNESGAPSKKRVNFALADSGDNELIVGSISTKDGTELETPNTRSRKRKADIETIVDLSDQIVSDKDISSLSGIESSAPTPLTTSTTVSALPTPTPTTSTVACTPPPKKRANFVLAQSNDENDLFVTPLSPVKSPRRDDQQLKGTSSTAVTPTTSGGKGVDLGSIVETPISETRSTRSSRKRRADSEAETASSADEGVSSMREESLSSATPAKKRVNFALGNTIEVIGDDEDEDGDDDDSDSVDEKRKEKRLSMRKRTPVHRPLLSSMESPQPILKIHKRAVDSSPVLLHFGSDSNDDGGESEGGGVGGLGVGEGEGGRGFGGSGIIKGLVESRGPSEFFDFTINGCCFHIRHQSGRLTPFLPNESEGNYACMNNCGYRTSRMNNIILHNKDQCTVIKMQWQSEIQHLINRQRFTNQDESDSVTPITSPKPTTSSTSITPFAIPTTDSNSMDTDTDPIDQTVLPEPSEPAEVAETCESEAPLSPTKSTTFTQDPEEKEVTSSPNPSPSSSPSHEPPVTTSSEIETPKEEEEGEKGKGKEEKEEAQTEAPETFEKESVPENSPTPQATEPTEPIEHSKPSESSAATEPNE